jgi:hypothetical protein
MDRELGILYSALHSQSGVAIGTVDPTRDLQRLYRARRTSETLSVLSFQRRGQEIWIIRKELLPK